MSKIPIIDLSACFGVNSDVKDDDSARIVKQLDEAFSTQGVAYLINHGIDSTLVEKVFQTSRSYFQELPFEIKNRHPLNIDTMDGYSFPSDVYSPKTKQNYDFTHPDTPLPVEHCPEFRPSVNHLASKLVSLTDLILKLLAPSLGLEKEYLSSRHKLMFCGADKNATVLASLHYEPLTTEKVEEIGGIRAGEHTDNGTITLIMQDEVGGLEVKVDGEWLEAQPIPGSIVVLTADLIQMWTADRYKACVHRVVAPVDEAKRRSVRQSLVFFVDPDNGVRVAPLDGSDKYPPIVAPEYQKRRQLETGYIKIAPNTD